MDGWKMLAGTDCDLGSVCSIDMGAATLLDAENVFT